MTAAKSNTERAVTYRERLKQQGGRETSIRFTSEAAAALDAMTERNGEGQSEAVCRAVVKLNAEEEAQQPQE